MSSIYFIILSIYFCLGYCKRRVACCWCRFGISPGVPSYPTATPTLTTLLPDRGAHRRWCLLRLPSISYRDYWMPMREAKLDTGRGATKMGQVVCCGPPLG
ncbi:hypothetical protein EDB86DRAFT_3000105 [Lactarius hatsudake]|nr:hypothetical protein EDB86DRAFT_3000105 [Lactarius hatsudake]